MSSDEGGEKKVAGEGDKTEIADSPLLQQSNSAFCCSQETRSRKVKGLDNVTQNIKNDDDDDDNLDLTSHRKCSIPQQVPQVPHLLLHSRLHILAKHCKLPCDFRLLWRYVCGSATDEKAC
jgi:hypothetical protein